MIERTPTIIDVTLTYSDVTPASDLTSNNHPTENSETNLTCDVKSMFSIGKYYAAAFKDCMFN